ncbi:MAG: hypothetical protein ABFQ53_03380 [Patescibacteria group bacterium]
MRTFFVILVGVISFLYLLNPTAGFVELIPDNIPVVGNLDEAGATALFIAVLGYFGIDLTKMFVQNESISNRKDIKDAEFEEVEND